MSFSAVFKFPCPSVLNYSVCKYVSSQWAKHFHEIRSNMRTKSQCGKSINFSETNWFRQKQTEPISMIKLSTVWLMPSYSKTLRINFTFVILNFTIILFCLHIAYKVLWQDGLHVLHKTFIINLNTNQYVWQRKNDRAKTLNRFYLLSMKSMHLNNYIIIYLIKQTCKGPIYLILTKFIVVYCCRGQYLMACCHY